MRLRTVEAARRGLTIVKVRDPVIYGRAGEEVLFFQAHGFEPLVVPGISSALAAPIFAGIPVTQRGVAESVVVCIGIWRQGKEVKLPGYERSRTVLILMGVARIAQVVGAMIRNDSDSGEGLQSVASTLGDICEALDSAGEQRPSGMMVVGWAALVLQGADEERIRKWLGGGRWVM
ncbi:tetrapyrrole methylase [Suillus occidentalis]|nr:tetrapyrrole methylase [Suillus occidentalis]